MRRHDGADAFEASDVEPAIRGERLDLLTVVRALESLDQPSRVTLVRCSSYVRQGMQYGLAEWRTNGWQWEFFGRMVPVKNGDLWQRLDRAMRFHQVECRTWRIDPAHDPLLEPNLGYRPASEAAHAGQPVARRPSTRASVRRWLASAVLSRPAELARTLIGGARAAWHRLKDSGTAWIPRFSS